MLNNPAGAARIPSIMNPNPLVSIILPAYNSEKTVGDAIVSILLQTYINWELLFIDDGSTDATLEVARKFADSRIKIYADGTAVLEGLKYISLLGTYKTKVSNANIGLKMPIGMVYR